MDLAVSQHINNQPLPNDHRCRTRKEQTLKDDESRTTTLNASILTDPHLCLFQTCRDINMPLWRQDAVCRRVLTAQRAKRNARRSGEGNFSSTRMRVSTSQHTRFLESETASNQLSKPGHCCRGDWRRSNASARSTENGRSALESARPRNKLSVHFIENKKSAAQIQALTVAVPKRRVYEMSRIDKKCAER